MRLKGIENLAKELLNRDQKVVIFNNFGGSRWKLLCSSGSVQKLKTANDS